MSAALRVAAWLEQEPGGFVLTVQDKERRATVRSVRVERGCEDCEGACECVLSDPAGRPGFRAVSKP